MNVCIPISIRIEEICTYTSHENVCVWKQNAPLENLLPASVIREPKGWVKKIRFLSNEWFANTSCIIHM